MSVISFTDQRNWKDQRQKSVQGKGSSIMRHHGKYLICSLMALSLIASFSIALATTRSHHYHHVRHSLHRTLHHRHHIRHARRSHHVLQCVAFVRQSTDFKIHGNARDWWARAHGRYARGNRPEVGSVLSFRSTRRMPLGHVAVVRSIVNSRTILIDQSHWASNGISRDVRVVDISADNDWSAVRVALRGHSDGRLGSIYPTHGFIYARPDGTPAVAKTPELLAHKNNVTAIANNHVVEDNILHDEAKLSAQTASLPDINDSIFNTDAPNRALR